MTNVFILWAHRGKVLPMRVRRWSWARGNFFEVTRVQIRRWPYGHAFGRWLGTGPEEELNCAGCYEWRDVSDTHRT